MKINPLSISFITSLLGILTAFILLLSAPAVMAVSFAGAYSGTYSGGDSGTWALTVSSTGVITMTGYSNNLGGAITGSGQVSSNGSLTMAAGSVSTGSTFTGTINSATGIVSGTWTNSYYGIGGSISGSMNTTTASYAGNYSGNYSGGDSGTWATTISSTGALTMTGYSNNLQSAVTGSGQVSSNGSLIITAGSVSTGAIFYGTISPLTGAVSGTWTNSYYGISGSFSGSAATLDTTAPSVPSGLTANAISANQINLSWTASTDNVGVTAYKVYRGGTLLAMLGNVTNYSDTGLTASTGYSYTVAACDAANNCSAQSTAASATTQAVPDTQAPTVPSGLVATPVGSWQIYLSWNASTDNVGVTSYSIFRNGTLAGTSATTNFSDSGLTLSTSYSYTVAACDAALNCSAQSTSASATTVAGGAALNLAAGWNLAGNSVNAPLDVAGSFANAANVTTVWKWIPATSKWAFYTPSMTATNLAVYAASKSYDVLTTINGGEGFWVNAKQPFTAQLPVGTAITTSNFQDQLTPPNRLPMGWSLISTGDNPTPSAFNQALGVTPPAQGVIPLNITTLWTWDSGLSKWYFYAPSLEANGALSSYITSKNYLNFGTNTLASTTGFWVNHP